MNQRSGGGFTLIETLVAVTILTLAVAGPLYVADRAVVAAHNAQDQLTASYLAQEGIEYVRAMRDNEFLLAHRAGGQNASDTGWQSFAHGTFASCVDATCTLDPFDIMGAGPGQSLAPCTAACSPLYFNDSNGRFSLDTNGTQTKFTRTIEGQLAGTGYDMKIISTVRWTSRLTTYQVTITDHLTPWQ